MDGGADSGRFAQCSESVSERLAPNSSPPTRRKARFGAALTSASEAYRRKLLAARSCHSKAALSLIDRSHIVVARLDAIRQDIRGARATLLTVEADSDVPRVVQFASSFVASNCSSAFNIQDLVKALRTLEAFELETLDLWAIPTVVSLAAIERLAAPLVDESEQSEQATAWLHSLLACLQNVEWLSVMPSVSSVDRLLAEDPSGDFRDLDLSSKDAYRQAVARFADSASRSESEVVATAINLASVHVGAEAVERSHIGFYLLGKGRRELSSSLGVQRSNWRGISTDSAFLAGAAGVVLVAAAMGTWIAIETGISSLIASTMIALSSTLLIAYLLFDFSQWAAMRGLGSAVTLRMSWVKEVPAEARTLVVIPCLLRDLEDARQLCKRLLMHRLRNRVEGVSYALLTDFADADQPSDTHSESLVAAVVERLGKMNSRYGWSTGGFLLLHRNRVWSAPEQTWMGRGRKLGKLQDLNCYLYLGDPKPFARIFGDVRWLSGTRYVLTIDEDTELPWGSVARMVACIHHPLNRPRLKPDKTQLAHGRGVMQPSTSADAFSPHRNRYQDISAPGGGLKAYQSSAPNFYHDVLGAGSFTGKGIYDVACAYHLTSAVVCDREILSHDLVEGCLLGGSSVPDIELFESAPRSFHEEVWRQNRWARGDVQTVLWSIFGAGRTAQLTALSRFKLFAASVHHLFEVAAFSLLLVACAVPSGGPLLFSLAAATLLLAPAIRTLRRCGRAVALREGISHREGWANVRRDLERCAVVFGTLPARSMIVSVGFVAACYRYLWSRQLLLQWKAFRDSQLSAPRDPSHHLIVLNALAIVCVLTLSAFAGGWAPWLAAALAAVWTAGPIHLRSLSQLIDVEQPKQPQLIHLAWRTWCGVRTMMTASPRGLIPDSTGAQGPDERVSPTNIGMSLISIVSAEELGFVSRAAAVELALCTLRATRRLERRRGHLLNWYDGKTGDALTETISSVDCGNFLASLLILRAWLSTEPERDRWRRVARWGAELSASSKLASARFWHQAFSELIDAPGGAQSSAADLRERLSAAESTDSVSCPLRALAWECLRAAEPRNSAPAEQEALALVEQLLDCDIGIFLERNSGLLHVAIETAAVDETGALYDLLASEARLTVLVGVGRGDLDAHAWRKLRRSKISNSAPCLLSWSGSLFEHLMPELFFRSPPQSLLAASHANAVLSHRRASPVGPWGRAECGYRDQEWALYGPHGVREISLSGRSCDLDPVAPYASLLALPVDSKAAVANWDHLARLGLDSESGPYESITTHADGSAARLLRHYAHHQGMILGAICNHLTGALVSLMMLDNEMCAAASLLNEVVPEECSIRTDVN